MSAVNPMEEDTKLMSEEFVVQVEELVEQIAPAQPWWSQRLNIDQSLARWMDVREPIMSWLAVVAIYCGWHDYDELLKNLEDVWLTMLPIDMCPPQVTAQLPTQLLTLVQAGPYDAADHIRKMEREFQKRLPQMQAQMVAQTAAEAAPPMPPPEIEGSVLRSPGSTGGFA